MAQLILPWPVDKLRSWNRFAARRPHLQKSVRKRGPSRDTIDTNQDSRERTFYRGKRQLERQSRARGRVRCFNRSRRGQRVVRYALWGRCSSAISGRNRSSSARFGHSRSRIDRLRAEANRFHTRQSLTPRRFSPWSMPRIDTELSDFVSEIGRKDFDTTQPIVSNVEIEI